VGPGFVYLVGWREKGPIKIGVSGDPVKRLTDLQVACPYILHVFKAYKLPTLTDAFEIEQESLAALYQHAMQGEWVRYSAAGCSKTVVRMIERKGLVIRYWRPTPEERSRRERQLAKKHQIAADDAKAEFVWLQKNAYPTR
jgi:hypothetical protein